ncbi:MAG: hypothetical protein ABJE80_04080 [Reichenbachiella sp.]|uniref:hypothetical protein n=1 Tax=Reichenbachiella sp. TaxID=2184521 RepID=UPI003264F23A
MKKYKNQSNNRMTIKNTVLACALFFVCALSSCTGELEAENAQLKKDLAETQAQLKEQTKRSDFSKEQATTAKRRADEAEKALAECNGTK